MRKSVIKKSNLDRFNFAISSPAAARHFRDYCYTNNLIMGGVLESLVIEYLIKVGDIESEESLAVEEALTK